jgi:hypothetical protein
MFGRSAGPVTPLAGKVKDALERAGYAGRRSLTFPASGVTGPASTMWAAT